MAADLHGDGTKFTMAEIGSVLRVSAMQVSRDLRGLTDVKPPAQRGGRPPKESAPQPPSVGEDTKIKRLLDGDGGCTKPCCTVGPYGTQVHHAPQTPDEEPDPADDG